MNSRRVICEPRLTQSGLRLQEVVGKGGEIADGRRYGTGEVVGGDLVAGLGRVGEGLPVGAPLAHSDPVARSGALEEEAAGVVGACANSRDQPHHNHHDQHPPDHPTSVGTIRPENRVMRPRTSATASARLPPRYSLFGKVAEGLDVVEAMQKTATDRQR